MILTFAATRMLKDALQLMDVVFSHNIHPLPNIELGLETLVSLKAKIDNLLQSEDWNKKTPFDYNELYILYAAIHIYLVNLSMAGDKQRMATCQQLYKLLRTVIETTYHRTT